MSQRRGANTKETGGIKSDEMLPFSKALDGPASGGGIRSMNRESSETAHAFNLNSTTSDEEKIASVSIDDVYHAESDQIRTKQWQESYFARGCTLSTWEAEYVQLKENGWKGECSKMMDGKDKNPVPCGCCSAIICSALGAGRVGNIAVLKQTNEWVTEEVPDEENGGTKTERSTRPRLDFVVGPYWPMLCMVTYPLILGVSAVTLVTAIPKTNPLIALLWSICTIGLVVALAMTAFRDPGILPRYTNPPASQGESQW
eukprot:CAMPEP_0197174372 /NCGR_PEP_ID=MMETSP1423-20130617/922_1 /TAXON_ID=476441 /ORGANISM="Pseudo-nitzschia heimii, Strain UNC1101" /LENGTH=257 /DNA_ID=CAMNT_0042623295 /DNA_START=55 /DNA_END=825 /DNA_ORIENTATION=+